MRSNLFLLMLASAASIWPSSAIASGQTISNAGRNSVDVILELDNATLTPVDRNGVLYTKIHADGFGIETREGLPALPISLIKILTARDPAVQVICDVVKADTIRNILVHPAQQHAPAIANVPDQPTPFVLDKCYSADEPVPASPSYVASTMLLSGMPLTTVVLSPVSYNPVRKELILYRQVKFHVSYAAADPSPFVGMRPNQRDQLASAACNASSFALALARSYSAVATAGRNDVLIITTTAYKDAAETLAVWQRMKGLGSVVDARASWSSDAVKTRTTEFYNSTTPHPGFVLVLGGIGDVPASYMSNLNVSFSPFPTDLGYVCMDGDNDYLADMAGGRIPCTTADEAMTIVKKIVTYEKTPPTLASFYTTAAGASYWNDEGPPYGEEDDGFVRTCEIVRAHLKKSNIAADHLYYAAAQNGASEATNPQTYWSEGVGYDPTVAADIKVPNYGWNATATDINAALDNGRFLLYHYDHGLDQQWGQPAYSNSKIDLLKNADLLPVVLSIDCLCGNFNSTAGQCLAEKFISKDSGGAVGVVAASTPSYEGTNDILMCGIIDAIWPGIDFGSVFNVVPNATLPQHGSMPSMGEALNQGKFAMNMVNPATDLNRMHIEMYHWFGDPSMRIWTDFPATIAPTYSSATRGNGTFAVRNIGTIDQGMISLVNPATGELIGAGAVAGGSASIDLAGLSQGTNLTLTVTGINIRPYIANITIDSNAVVPNISNPLSEKKIAFAASLIKSGIQLTIPNAGLWTVTLYSADGRTLWHSQQNLGIGNNTIVLAGFHQAAGMKILSVEGPGIRSTQRIIER